jgi:hypothetical protein
MRSLRIVPKEAAMSETLVDILRDVPPALDRAFARALKQEAEDRVRVLDIDHEKIVIFSDHHKGNRDGADDFLACERAYNAALSYYHRQGYTLAVLGDVEELWEERPKTVLKAYPHTLGLEAKFHHSGRYLRFFGNHDDAWSHTDLVDKLLGPVLGEPLKVYEALIFHVRDEEAELGRLFLLHGHQGTLDSDDRHYRACSCATSGGQSSASSTST